ncbi:hypothetical protein ACFRIC_07240 [Streptomyces sp. NPDC056738]|uniref:hypothetical protein n=1 Tax=Streptomyces sp. NPDC056738 TaxID=3345933 RepID=UPI00367A75ED
MSELAELVTFVVGMDGGLRRRRLRLMDLWHVLADGERQQWIFDPFASVGPLRFGMTSDEASAVLGGVLPGTRQHYADWDVVCHTHSDVGLKVYFAAKGLRGVSIDARRGPQVHADETALVGQVPSELERWLFDRADSREPFTELFYLPGAEPGSLTLGVAFCVQRAGDRLLTRPVFLNPCEVMRRSSGPLGSTGSVVSLVFEMLWVVRLAVLSGLAASFGMPHRGITSTATAMAPNSQHRARDARIP